jgi:hypothetical protein
MASILLFPRFGAQFRIGGRQNVMRGTKNRLKEIQDQLDILMDELHRLQRNIAGSESRRRTYPFPFERAIAADRSEPIAPDPDTKH